MRPSHVALCVLVVALLAIVGLSAQVDWSFFVGVIVAAVAWELTKFRLRRNARRFANSDR